MAFLGLFKKKPKKDGAIATAPLEPLKSAEEKAIEPMINAPPMPPTIPEIPPINAPETPIKESVQEIPTIKAPKAPLAELKPTPDERSQPVGLPAAPKMNDLPSPPKEIPAPTMPPFLGGDEEVITQPNVGSPFMAPLNAKEVGAMPKESIVAHPMHDEEIKEKKELPGFPEEGIKEELPVFQETEEKAAPSPPSYLEQMGEVREGVAEEGGMRPNILRKPIFVEVNDYRKVIEEINSIKKDAKKSKDIAKSLEEFRAKKERGLKQWNKGLEKIQRNLVFMDKVLFEESG